MWSLRPYLLCFSESNTCNVNSEIMVDTQQREEKWDLLQNNKRMNFCTQ